MLFWQRSDGGFTSDFGPQAPNEAGVHHISHTSTIPANATGMIYAIGCAGSGSDPSFVTYIDRVMFGEDPFFSGDTNPDGELERTRWLGVANASASVLETRTLSYDWVPDVETPPVINPLLGHREERYQVELLNNLDESQGFLDGVEGGSLKWNANADLPGSGKVDLLSLSQPINFSKDRIRIWWEVTGVDPWPMGVYVLSAPATQYKGDGTYHRLILTDKLSVVREDVLLETLQIPAGTNIVQAAVDQVRATGENRIAFTDSDATLTNALTFPPGTRRQAVVNTLLDACGYWSLWTDRWGQFRIEPYIAPADRSVVWPFEEGETSIHSPEWEHELALWEATNTVVLTSQPDDNDQFFKAYAVDDNPDSPTSTVSMGRVLNAIVEENVEASSQLDLQTQANRKLLDNSNVVGKLEVSHAPVPVWYNEAVSFRSQGMDTLATITQMSLKLEAGSLVRATWRQV